MDELYFVDPDQAVEQLQSIHEEMYRASKEFDSCRSLPVADHALGMGKTTFAHHYVRLCLKTWPIEATRTDFRQTICAAHTVMCRLESGVFVHEVSAQVTMNDLLAKAVRRHLSPETELSVLTPPLSTSPQTFAEDLVAAIGPLFIVLDNVGDAFGDGNLDEKTSRDRFAQFCKDVLLSWTQVPGLVFVVLGHAPFLRFFKSMNSSLNAKPWYLERLPLFCLEPPQVQRILRHTLHKAALPETLVDRWGLTSLELEEDATSVLFDLSGGHPGTIMRFLRDYTTYESFKLYAIGDNWLDFYRDAWRWRGILQDWIVTFRLPRGNTRIIDLSRAEMLEDDKWVDISYGEVMRHCHLLWEGTLIEASVFAHPVVEDAIMNVVLPLNLYALRVCEMAPRRTLSYAMAFQWMCVKRLQDLIDQLLVPRVASPLFFELEKRECKSMIVKPRVEWALPDALMMTRMPASEEKADSKFDVFGGPNERSTKRQRKEMETLTVGLLTRKAIDNLDMVEGCRKFHELFVSLDAKTRREFGRMTNVLIVCATAYSDDLPSFSSKDDGFVSMDVPPECGNVTEVLLLNLTMNEKRDQFFGWEKDEMLVDAVETIVTNL
ncbi:hypothetical protein Poli38472_014369 [Pythium oligandrum]|uniref:Uncharacterized protein n=1 Tax=Pythium oligandrum TaxID=41045 RepID=A0A8K1FCZ2_PYTOL|nr:hypothetical protein Poli38472_014369 [Pythium oligandrum]|eukprot:TMW57766.1 hypothetical protein Poli38472_014369 [Pythium oligandrum]